MSEETQKELAAKIIFCNPSINIRTDVHGDKIATFKAKLDQSCVGKAALLALMKEVSFEADVFVVGANGLRD